MLMSGRDKNKIYLNYLKDHPEVLEDEPPHVSSPSFWQMMLEEGRCTGEEMYKSVYEARQKWEKFHLEKAKLLGLDISIQRLHLDKSWIIGITANSLKETDSENQQPL